MGHCEEMRPELHTGTCLLRICIIEIIADYCCNDCHSDSEMRRLSAFLNENKEAIRGKMITICDMDESCLENLKKLTSVNIDSEYEEDDGDEFLCAHIYC
ncbi:hypothetical protein QR680_014920 [Steinernema hermaphroditum]|uniref:Uncharacterized protein n=1 Tax=Steinernema hermaphroditum TaxID=289476 RepID=A0AA39M531_9BILA|nr:hypothetical protein QR680_014920 [Steinernema hermaphroditum]